MPTCLDYEIARLFADNTNLILSSCNLPIPQDNMSKDFKEIAYWLDVNNLALKTDFMLMDFWTNNSLS